ncbi:MAG: transporter, partial [Sandaracinaceae bacterium]|nr:transporter [Sandaracinaceae bacterium]
MNRASAWLFGAGACLLVLGALRGRVEAQGQGIYLNQYRMAETAIDGFALSTPNDLGHLNGSARLAIDYALNPLVYEAMVGRADTERYPYVENMLSSNVALALGLFDRLVLYGGLPATLFSDGNSMAALRADGTQVGDPYVGARLRLFGERSDPFALGLQVALSLPLSEAASASQSYSGERSVTFLPRLAAQLRLANNRLRLGLNLGARIREHSEIQQLRVGHELTYGAGLVAELVAETVDLVLEAYGATGFEQGRDGRGGFFGRESSPAEALLGLRIHPVCEVEIGLAGGTGISRGYGASDFRGLLTLGYAGNPACQKEAPQPQPVEKEPVAPAPAEGDRDGDGLLDSDDRCPNEPEDRDNFEDQDGCPDPDNDRDGILDGSDRCPNEPEDRDNFEDQDGCPDPDNDRDGILDGSDRCPNEPEDRDNFEDQDGCPDPDND